jgi:hypothetical protein
VNEREFYQLIVEIVNINAVLDKNSREVQERPTDNRYHWLVTMSNPANTVTTNLPGYDVLNAQPTKYYSTGR